MALYPGGGGGGHGGHGGQGGQQRRPPPYPPIRDSWIHENDSEVSSIQSPLCTSMFIWKILDV